MSTFVTIVGGVVVIAAALMVLFVLAWFVLDTATRFLDRHDDYVAMRARASVGQVLRSEAWWFSEHEPTRKLLASIADNLLADRTALSDVSQSREDWRKDMADDRGRPQTQERER